MHKFTKQSTIDSIKKVGSRVEMIVKYRSKEGIDWELDRKIERLARRKCRGTGFSFQDGKREVIFDGFTPRGAYGAAERIKMENMRLEILFFPSDIES